jgi:outer membrane protein W
MYKTTRELIQIENITIAGTQVRYLDFIPITIGVDYHFLGRDSRVRPYVGVAGGAYRVRQRMEIGTVNLIIHRDWHAGVVPEAGFTFLTPDMEFYGFISAEFNYVFSRDDSIDYTYVTFSLGIVYLL